MAAGWIRRTGAAPRARAFVAACEQSLSGEVDGRRGAVRAVAAVPVRDGSDTLISQRADGVDRSIAALPLPSAESLWLSAKNRMNTRVRLRLSEIPSRRSLGKTKRYRYGKAKPYRTVRRQSRSFFVY